MINGGVMLMISNAIDEGRVEQYAGNVHIMYVYDELHI